MTTAAPPPIVVVVTDSSVALSREAALAGRVVFRVVNRGQRVHDFRIAGHGARLQPGRTATVTVSLPRVGTYIWTSGTHRGAFGIEKTFGVTPANPPGCPAPKATTVTVAIAHNRFHLSETTVPCGIVTFVITNEGNAAGEDEPDSFNLGVRGGNGPTLTRDQTGKLVLGLPPGRYSYTAGNYENNYAGQYGTLVVTA
jgi:hypothetical protein